MNFAESMAYIQSFSKSGAAVKDLSRMRSLLDEIDHPEEKLRFVHFAGTNGKGSTLALSSAAAIEAGYRIGQFTSPYMVRYNDRIRINGCDIPDERLAVLCSRVAVCRVARDCSQFEVTLAIALLYFLEENCDLVFLETGLGGLLDATNVITSPLVSVITSISLDHMAILGETLPEIAMQKAGIIKENCPVILADDNKKEIVSLISNIADAHHAVLHVPDKDNCIILEETMSGTRFLYCGVEYTLQMPGLHQVSNAMTAIETIRVLRSQGYAIQETHIVSALAKVQVPGRIQKIGENPDVFLDGGHNEAGVSAFADVLRTCSRPVILICGMLTSKDYRTAARILSNAADYVICVDSFTHGTVPHEELMPCFAEKCHVIYLPLERALPYAKTLALQKNGIVAIGGSLYLASCYLGDGGMDAC